MEKERLDLLLVYANDLYRYIAKKLGEDYEPKNLIGLLGWLDEHNVIIHIQPEFYSQGINWNWQISFYNPETFSDPDLMDGTGLYGDNGEYPTRGKAMCCSIVRALELYILEMIDSEEILGDYKLPMPSGTTVQDLLIYMIRNQYSVTVDEKWSEMKRKSINEYFNYLKERIIECWEKVV